jgi:uncharacterized NAD(P)/FAD-binding protein YdhS
VIFEARSRVAVIGGGFCGAFFAAQLAHYSRHPVRVSVIEPRAALGGGVAYSTSDPAHRINVPASRMILFPERPADFDGWFRRGGGLEADPEALWADGAVYPRRAAFGRYIEQILERRRQERPDVTIEHVRDAAASVEPTASGYRIYLARGGQVEAEIVILATSHPPPGLPALIGQHLAGDPGLIANPWQPDAVATVAPDDDVLIIGTGLTMADVVASLTRRGHRGRITAFSRRGLLPRGHAKIPVLIPFAWYASHQPPRGLLPLLRHIRQQIAETSLPWQSVFDDVRANGQKLWRQLGSADRRRFLRHLRVYWDSHRYRIAPQIEKILVDKQVDQTLHVLAASLVSARREGDKINVLIRPRRERTETLKSVLADRVIITTGPLHGTVVEQNPALRGLAALGLLQADELGLGVKVDELGRVVSRYGASNPNLLVVGPLAREQYGELMGLPQVAAQPDAVAAHVASCLSSGTSPAHLVLAGTTIAL